MALVTTTKIIKIVIILQVKKFFLCGSVIVQCPILTFCNPKSNGHNDPHCNQPPHNISTSPPLFQDT